MQHLFSPEGERALAALARHAPLLAFDFDGTLAPIVSNPDDAAAPPALAECLRDLAALRPLAIISGRAVADVAPRLGFAPQWVIGNHGAEDPERPAVQAADADGRAIEALRHALAVQSAALEAAGVSVEDKRQSLAFHYRRAPDHAAAEALIERVLDGLHPALRTFGGKCVVNVVDAGSRDKGDAVVTLLERSGSDAAFFIGDDVNDESVFTRAQPHWLTVRIGRDADSQAMYGLDDQSEVEPMLRKLIAHLQQAATPTR